jgi:hypothetical protein
MDFIWKTNKFKHINDNIKHIKSYLWIALYALHMAFDFHEKTKCKRSNIWVNF